MRLSEIEDYNLSQKDKDGLVFGHKVPDWSIDDDEVAIFDSRTGFDYAQVFRLKNGKYFADFGHNVSKEFDYVGGLETELRKRRMTSFDRIDYYNPSSE